MRKCMFWLLTFALATGSKPLFAQTAPAAPPTAQEEPPAAEPPPAEEPDTGGAHGRYLLTQKERDRELETHVPDPSWLVYKGGAWRLWYAQLLFQQGKTKEAQAIVWGAIRGLSPTHKNFQIMFPILDCYLGCKDKMDAGLREAVKNVFVDNARGEKNPLYRGTTSNLAMLANINCHLMLQEWGPESLTPSVKKEMTAKDTDRSQWLLGRVQSIAMFGSGEFASRPYAAGNLLPLLTLAKYSKNKALRERSIMAFEASMAHAAGTWLRGHWAVPSGRSYPDTMSQFPNTNIQHLWYYFGGLTGDRPNRCDTSIVAKMSGLKLPPMIVTAGTDRSQPHVSRSRFDSDSRFQYTYMNKRYALFSAADSRRAPIFGQTYPYGVMWDEPDPARGSFLWITAPCNDRYPLPDHAHGVNGYHIQYLQHEGTLLMVLDSLDKQGQAHPNWWHPYVLCHVPVGARAVLDEAKTGGRIFFHYNTVLIAILSTEKFEWNRKPGLVSDPKSPHSEFRIKGSNLAVALETALPEDYPGKTPQEQLQVFRDALVAKTKLRCAMGENNHNVAYYTDRHGVNLEKPFNPRGDKNTARIDGKPVNYESWPMIDNPWIHQDYGGTTLTITDGKQVRTYDFKNWTVTENPCAPK